MSYLERKKEHLDRKHYEMFGCTEDDLKAMLNLSLDFNSPLMLAASILSDAQEVLERGDNETARQYMNKSKWVIFELMKEDRKC